MRQASFTVDALFDFDGRRFRLAHKLPNRDWQTVDIETGLLNNFPWADMIAAYEAGHLTLVPVGIQDEKTQTAPFADLPEDRQARGLNRLTFVRTFEERRRGRRLERADLKKLLAEVSDELGWPKPVSCASFYRWRAALAEAGTKSLIGGKMGPQRRRVSGEAICRQVMLDAIVAAKQDRKVGLAPVATLKAMRQKASRLIKDESARRSLFGASEEVIEVPSKSSFNRIWNDLPAEDRAIAQVGRVQAKHLFRGGSGPGIPSACLDLVEYDETRVPTFLFDERLGVPLGRPWLAWYVDRYSSIPVGIYVGFENPSDLTITSALRHCCLPKAYVAREYPSIVNHYVAAGIPRHVVFDNGLAQWGQTIEQVGFDLDMSISYTAPRTPWFKARVEGMFEVLNRTLLREMPGFVLAKDMHEYDPTKHGCMGLRHFLHVLHAWLVDVFMQEPHGLLMQSPAALWEKGTRNHAPSFLAQSQELDLLFGIKRMGRLDHRGVRFENLRYHSPELHDLRRRYGDKLAVEVKVNPSNLGVVHVRIPDTASSWVRAEASLAEYAENLSLHRHKLNQKNAREQFGDDSAVALMKAQDRLHELIADALPAALSIRSNSLIARTLGIGTQHIFDNLNHDGELGALSGPFAGESLNRANTAARQSSGSATKGGDAEARVNKQTPRPRVPRTFDGDHSLKGRVP